MENITPQNMSICTINGIVITQFGDHIPHVGNMGGGFPFNLYIARRNTDMAFILVPNDLIWHKSPIYDLIGIAISYVICISSHNTPL